MAETWTDENGNEFVARVPDVVEYWAEFERSLAADEPPDDRRVFYAGFAAALRMIETAGRTHRASWEPGGWQSQVEIAMREAADQIEGEFGRADKSGGEL